MEPPLGTISFTLLCIQWAREQRVLQQVLDHLKAARTDHVARKLVQLPPAAPLLPPLERREGARRARRAGGPVVTRPRAAR